MKHWVYGEEKKTCAFIIYLYFVQQSQYRNTQKYEYAENPRDTIVFRG